jgi:hypothetical protein
VPLLQDMLEAAYHASGGEKNGPLAFRWPTAQQLAQIQRRRDRQRKNRKDSTAASRHYKTNWARDHREEKNRAARIAYHASKELRKRKADAQRERRADQNTRAQDSERLSRRKDKQHAREKSLREYTHLMGIAAVSLAEIERPSYRVETPRGATYTEIWPADDEAARLISFAATLEAEIGRRVDSIPEWWKDTMDNGHEKA